MILDLSTRIGKNMLEGKKLILMGNGGSAADSQHIAAEFVGKFQKERRPLMALALNTNTSSVTAIGNDYGYEKVFERQVEAFAREGDIVIGLSTSGNSENVVRAIEAANRLGCITVGMTGKSGGKLAEKAKYAIKVDSSKTSIIQEVHITIGHIMSNIIEDMI
ncbi:MAG: SIS domain-containing protein [Candidatus Micrarchaeota archaeon]|nr:SIS domain-containing protein [Candidatus Micrarchaeota archaeon]MDE1824321.1 SIS domain-containing protein [Candidatus Micrarchaeota archaeon]MDE1850005.1 SIS domain-containing protein [Candidatus Micrarchaeota archaeon]